LKPTDYIEFLKDKNILKEKHTEKNAEKKNIAIAQKN